MNAATGKGACFGPTHSLRLRVKASIRVLPTARATSARVRDMDLVIADGPFAETKELILGMIVVDGLDDDIAGCAPHLVHREDPIRCPQWLTIPPLGPGARSTLGGTSIC